MVGGCVGTGYQRLIERDTPPALACRKHPLTAVVLSIFTLLGTYGVVAGALTKNTPLEMMGIAIIATGILLCCIGLIYTACNKTETALTPQSVKV